MYLLIYSNKVLDIQSNFLFTDLGQIVLKSVSLFLYLVYISSLNDLELVELHLCIYSNAYLVHITFFIKSSFFSQAKGIRVLFIFISLGIIQLKHILFGIIY